MLPSLSNILGFIGLALVLIVIPGPSVMFALGRTIASGVRVGLITVTFNAIGAGLWIFVVAFGLGGLLSSQPVAMTAIRLIGAAYLFYIGAKTAWDNIKDRTSAVFHDAGSGTVAKKLSMKTVAKDAFIVGITNPKVAVFFFAVLPQFVDSTEHATTQMLALGLLFSTLGIISDGSWVLAAGAVRSWLVAKPERAHIVQLVGGVLICFLAVLLAFGAFIG
jgi:threonine/homoserine/homoserine lactone efflux protein